MSKTLEQNVETLSRFSAGISVSFPEDHKELFLHSNKILKSCYLFPGRPDLPRDSFHRVSHLSFRGQALPRVVTRRFNACFNKHSISVGKLWNEWNR